MNQKTLQYKNVDHPKQIHRFNTIPIKIPEFFCQHANSKIYMKKQSNSNCQNNFEKCRVGVLMLRHCKAHYKATLIRKYGTEEKKDIQNNGTEYSPEMGPHKGG